MKILGLVGSDVHGGNANIPKQDLYPERMVVGLEKALGEGVEVVSRAVWPTPELPALVDRWMREFEPDLVVFSVSGYPFLYESTPVRIERRLGPVGRLIGQTSRKAAAQPRLAHNRTFQWSRKAVQRIIGGEAWFTAKEVSDISKQVISAVLRSESGYIEVFGPSGGEKWSRNHQHLNRLIARRRWVDRELAEFCQAHHVAYWDEARRATIADPKPKALQGDDLHLNKEGHKRMAEYQFDLALGMARRAREHAGASVGAAVHT
ncbi:MAG: hypothetical protein AB7J35_11880 [Dehalococcoidia bacterium]